MHIPNVQLDIECSNGELYVAPKVRGEVESRR